MLHNLPCTVPFLARKARTGREEVLSSDDYDTRSSRRHKHTHPLHLMLNTKSRLGKGQGRTNSSG